MSAFLTSTGLSRALFRDNLKKFYAFLKMPSIFGLLLCTCVTPLFAEEPVNWQIWYQPSASPVMDRIEEMHGYLLYIIGGVAFLVTGLLIYTIVRFRDTKNKTPSPRTHNVPLEIVWTLVPLLIVLVIMVPSVRLIFFMDKVKDADLTVKVIGHQWNWEYVYPDHDVEFFSNMLKKDQLKPGQPRNLAVDEEVIVPVDTNVRILVTSADVIHSWAVPAFGIKSDCVPGRLRETWVRVKREGVYYGQCSEICGQGHGFMSIAVRAVPKEDFEAWVKAKGGKLPELKTAEALPQTSENKVAPEGVKKVETAEPQAAGLPAAPQESDVQESRTQEPLQKS